MAIQLSGILDPRTVLQKLNRFQLREIILYAGKDISPNVTADRMRRFIEDENIDISPFLSHTVHKQLIADPRAISKIAKDRRRAMRAEQEQVEEPKDVGVQVAALKMPQLKQLAKKLGIHQSPKDSKDELIRKITEHGNTA